jgi:diguanylate cyclase (GGDEF)-like protein
MTDPLTGLFNRRKFMELGDQEFKRFSRYHVVFSVQIIDLDFFKKVNDRFGHPAGDEALKQFSQLVIKQKRETDLLGRLGGEEFGILLLNTPVEAAAIFGERLRHLVQVTPITLGENQVGITISMGVTQAHSSDKNFGDVLLRADRLLYQAKGNGRNRMETSV